ncbi:MAG: hypothetical protein AAF732_09470 [Pseudomonadota bacterium]
MRKFVAGVVACVACLATQTTYAHAMPPVRLTPSNLVPQCVTPDRLMAFAQSRNPRINHRYDNLAEIYAAEGKRLGIRWDFAFFHMLHETGDLTYRRSPTVPGPVAPEQNNFADIGAVGPGASGESFSDIRAGVQAHLEHLLVYAGVNIAQPVAARTRNVQKWGVLKPWLASLSRPVTFADLSLRWAMGEAAYVRSFARVAQAFYVRFCPDADRVLTTLVHPPRLATAWRATKPPAGPSGPVLADGSSGRWSIKAKPKPSALGARDVGPGRADVANAAKRRPDRTDRSRTITDRRVKMAALHRRIPASRRQTARTPAARKADHPLHRLVSGNKVYLTTSMGATIPMRFLPDGRVIGHANGYSFFLGAATDRGRWWIEDSMLCTKWRVWLDREKHCIRILRKRGKTIYWRSASGKTGTARIIDG